MFVNAEFGDYSISVWDFERFQEVKLDSVKKNRENKHPSYLFLTNDKYFILLIDNKIYFWDNKTGELVNDFSLERNYILHLCKGTKLASIDKEKGINILDLNFIEDISLYETHPSAICSITALDDNEHIIFQREDHITYIRNRKTEKQKRIFLEYEDTISTNFISLEHGKKFIAGTQKGSMYIWDTLTLTKQKSFYLGDDLSKISLCKNENELFIFGKNRCSILHLQTGHIKTSGFPYISKLSLSSQNLAFDNTHENIIWIERNFLKSFNLRTKEVQDLLPFETLFFLLIGNKIFFKIKETRFQENLCYLNLENKRMKIICKINPYAHNFISLHNSTKIAWIEDNLVKFFDLVNKKEISQIFHSSEITFLISNNKDEVYLGDRVGGIYCWKLSWEETGSSPKCLWSRPFRSISK